MAVRNDWRRLSTERVCRPPRGSWNLVQEASSMHLREEFRDCMYTSFRFVTLREAHLTIFYTITQPPLPSSPTNRPVTNRAVTPANRAAPSSRLSSPAPFRPASSQSL